MCVYIGICVKCAWVHMCECGYVCIYACVLASDIVMYLGFHSSLLRELKELHAFLYVGEAHAVHSRHTVHYVYCKRPLWSFLRLYIRRIHHGTMNHIYIVTLYIVQEHLLHA